MSLEGIKIGIWIQQSEPDTALCFTKYGAVQNSVLYCSSSVTVLKIIWKYKFCSQWKPAILSKMNFFASIFQVFWPQLQNNYFSGAPVGDWFWSMHFKYSFISETTKY